MRTFKFCVMEKVLRGIGCFESGHMEDLTFCWIKTQSVTSSIPDYFPNSEPPIICYKYNKPIRHTIFNFNKLVSDLDIHANIPSS